MTVCVYKYISICGDITTYYPNVSNGKEGIDHQFLHPPWEAMAQETSAIFGGLSGPNWTRAARGILNLYIYIIK